MESSGSAPYAREASSSPGSLLSSMASSSFSAFSDEDGPSSGNLLSLVQPELTTLAHHWLSALRDHALLSLPPGKKVFHSSTILILLYILLYYEYLGGVMNFNNGSIELSIPTYCELQFHFQ